MRRIILAGLLLSITGIPPSYAQDFPIGIMSIGSQSFDRLPVGSFTLVHNYAFELHESGYDPAKNNNEKVKEFLDSASANGLSALIGFSRYAIKITDIEYIKARVSAFKDHPALYGWYLYDEPEGGRDHYASPDVLKKAYDIIKSIDTKHPVLITTYEVYRLGNPYLNALDILITDQYPVPDYPPDQILSRIDPAAKVTKEISKSNWAVIQAHDTGLYGKGKRTRYPTKDEMRFMSYIAVMHGVKGLMFYCYNDGVNNLGSEEARPHWKNLTELIGELKEMSPVFADSSVAVLTTKGKLEAWTKKYQGSNYLIVANRSDKTIDTSLDVSSYSMKDSSVDVLFENRIEEISGGLLHDMWKSWEVHVYKVQ